MFNVKIYRFVCVALAVASVARINNVNATINQQPLRRTQRSIVATDVSSLDTQFEENQFKEIRRMYFPQIERYYLIIKYHSAICSYGKWPNCYSAEIGATKIGFNAWKSLFESDNTLMRLCNGVPLPAPNEPFRTLIRQHQQRRSSSGIGSAADDVCNKPIIYSQFTSLTAIASIDGIANVELISRVNTQSRSARRMLAATQSILDNILYVGGTEATLKYSDTYATNLNKLGLNRPRLIGLIDELDDWVKINGNSREMFTRLPDRIVDEMLVRLENRIRPKLNKAITGSDKEITFDDIRVLFNIPADNAFNSQEKELFLRRCIHNISMSSILMEFDHRTLQKFDHLLTVGADSCSLADSNANNDHSDNGETFIDKLLRYTQDIGHIVDVDKQ